MFLNEFILAVMNLSVKKRWEMSLLAISLLAIPGSAQTIYEEVNGLIGVEAEHYASQEKVSVRKWYKITRYDTASAKPDPDPSHASLASGQTYLEILPDSRVTKDDPLIPGENYSNTPGELGVLTYTVYFNTTGKYYVWVRAYSEGAEDNGLHVGINSKWPSSGQRMQWCAGKNKWTWECRQRTDANHCGTPLTIFLHINTSGQHTIQFSMREDGFEFDKWAMSNDPSYTPTRGGPDERIRGQTRLLFYSTSGPIIASSPPTQGAYDISGKLLKTCHSCSHRRLYHSLFLQTKRKMIWLK